MNKSANNINKQDNNADPNNEGQNGMSIQGQSAIIFKN